MQKNQKSYQNKIRIIGGKWRGRVLHFPDVTGLRPTPNRVRETLFNWLTPIIYGSHCLDLFSGSGALGFEALSRGAAKATLIDFQSTILTALKENKALLTAESANIINLELPSSCFSSEQPFDVVFLDPPFEKNLIGPCCVWLESQGLLAKNAQIYIEAEKKLNPLPTPSHWRLLKSKTAGQVSYYLYVTQ